MLIRLGLRLLEIWGFGAIFLALMAFSAYAFRGISFRVLMQRLSVIAVWPLALLSAAGRSRLFSIVDKDKFEGENK